MKRIARIALLIIVLVTAAVLLAVNAHRSPQLSDFVDGPLPRSVQVIERWSDEQATNPVYDASHAWHIKATPDDLQRLITTMKLRHVEYNGDEDIGAMTGRRWFHPGALGAGVTEYDRAPKTNPGVRLWLNATGDEAYVSVFEI